MRIEDGSLVRWSGQQVEGGLLYRLDDAGRDSRRWIGVSYCWLPRSLDVDRPLWAVASSRLGRHPHRRPHWFQMLERAMEAATQCDAQMLVCQRTASESWVRHACQLYRVDWVEVVVADWDGDVEQWLEQTRNAPPADRLLISPPQTSDRLPTNIPRRDVAAVALASRLYAPHVAAGGNIERLLKRRLSDPASNAASVWVAVDPREPTSQSLIDLGAVGWLPTRSSDPDEVRYNDQDAGWITLDQLLDQRGQSMDSDPWIYLSHCTRERSGPWPNQSDKAYRDELMLTRGEPSAGPLASLERILATERIEATSRVTRGTTPVVCFSARPLPRLLNERTFRSHLGRWDYEPYGIAIREDTLRRLGGRAVVYGDEATFQAMDESLRPFFQSEGTRTDWKQEWEWRVLGSVDLREVRVEEAFIFVPTSDEAGRITQKSRWPIVVIPV